MTESTTQRVKVQVGKPNSSSQILKLAETNQPIFSTATNELNQIDFENSSERPLMDLCDSNYYNKQKRRNRPSKKRVGGAERDDDNDVVAAKAVEKKQKTVTNPPEVVDTGPRVEVINGIIVLKESSLVVGESATVEGEYEEVVEGIHPTSRYSSFTDKRNPCAWGIEETRFDFDMLLLPHFSNRHYF